MLATPRAVGKTGRTVAKKNSDTIRMANHTWSISIENSMNAET